MMQDLTPRQQEIFDYLQGEIAAGYPPTIREVMKRFGVKSPNGIYGTLKSLKKKGWIICEPKLSRSIRLTAEAERNTRGIPIVELADITE